MCCTARNLSCYALYEAPREVILYVLLLVATYPGTLRPRHRNFFVRRHKSSSPIYLLCAGYQLRYSAILFRYKLYRYVLEQYDAAHTLLLQ